MTIPVVWCSYKPDIAHRGYWDQGLIERLFDKTLWRVPGGQPFDYYNGFDELPERAEGAVVVLPARHHADLHSEQQLQRDLHRLGWVLLILTGDEESIFPWWRLSHPNMRLWIMDPRPDTHDGCDAMFIGSGWHYDTPDVLAALPDDKTLSWVFAGQITHERREQCAAALRSTEVLSSPVGRGLLIETPGFIQGIDRHDYLARLKSAQLAPCPSGPASPDSFRFYEALEAGCIPIADAKPPAGWHGFWQMLFGETVPFPIIEEWDQVVPLMDHLLTEWPRNANRVFAWWQQQKRRLAYRLQSDLDGLGASRAFATPDDLITVLIPTSPIPAHPDTTMIETVVASVRAQLPDAEIIIMCDGVRPEQEDRRADYEEYIRRLLHLTNRWHNVVPLVAEEHLHQGNLTRLALTMVETPQILFVEHDAPIYNEIDWPGLIRALGEDDIKLIRLHHESVILDVHKHMMLDAEPRLVAGVPLIRTWQYSQRPHLARTDFYRWLIDTYFGIHSRTMIEDTVYGVLVEAFERHGEEGWRQLGVAIYAPAGDTKRSYHLDGRAGDSKFDMWFSYPDDDAPPEGSPYPSAKRVAE